MSEQFDPYALRALQKLGGRQVLLRGLQKEAGLIDGSARMLGTGAKSLANFALGSGTNAAGKWDLFHGLKSIGKVKETVADGALKGMRVLDPKTGVAKVREGRDMLGYMRQEFQGTRPTRADMMASMRASKAPLTAEGRAQHLANGGAVPGSKTWYGRTVKEPAGVNQGEYMQRVQGGDPALAGHMDELSNVNKMSRMDFIRQHPGVAAKYYGMNALQKGFMVGLPGYEAYDTIANRTGPHPTGGMGENLGHTVGSTLGWASMMPLGWVGGPLAVDGISAAARGIGKGVDKLFGNKPLGGPGVPPVTKTHQVPNYGLRQAQQAALNPAGVPAQAQQIPGHFRDF